jgi:hypothetical protein
MRCLLDAVDSSPVAKEALAVLAEAARVAKEEVCRLQHELATAQLRASFLLQACQQEVERLHQVLQQTTAALQARLVAALAELEEENKTRGRIVQELNQLRARNRQDEEDAAEVALGKRKAPGPGEAATTVVRTVQTQREQIKRKIEFIAHHGASAGTIKYEKHTLC